MKTLQPCLKRGRNQWDRINMPIAEYHARVARIRKQMIENSIDVLLLYGNGLNDYGNSTYISNVMMETVGGILVVIPVQGQVALIFEGGERLIPYIKSQTWIEELETGPRVSDECIKYLKKRDLLTGTIGFAGLRQLMPYGEWQLIRGATGQCNFVNAVQIMRDMRSLKSLRESDQMRRSSRIASMVMHWLVDVRLRAMNERVIEAEAERCAYLAGAGDFRMMIGWPEEEGWAFRPPGERTVESDDNIIVYIAVAYEGYWTECVRTYRVQASSLTMTGLDEAGSLFEKILAGIKENQPISSFYDYAVMTLVKSKAGYLPAIGLGNSIGLGPEEPPYVTENEGMKLKTGMWLALRLVLKENENKGIMIGHSVYLAENGPEIVI